MKAAVLHGAHDIRYETVPDPIVEPTSIVLKVKACGVCGTDLHIYKLGEKKGLILGHEFSGEVAEVGADVSDIKPGDRVIAVGYRPCLECYWCKKGQVFRCSNLAIAGDQIPGAFAEYISIPFAKLGRNVFKLSDKLTYEEAATVEPLSVGYYSVKRAQPQPQDTVVVIGVGIIGLGIVQILKTMGVSKIIATGRRPKRLELAKMSGADVVIDAASEDPLAAVSKITSGLGVDIVLECAGSPESFRQSIEMVRGGGKVMLVALYESPITWDPAIAIYKNVTLIGCLGGNFPKVLELLETGKINAKPLIVHQFPLSRISEAFETQIKAQDAVKVMVKM